MGVITFSFVINTTKLHEWRGVSVVGVVGIAIDKIQQHKRGPRVAHGLSHFVAVLPVLLRGEVSVLYFWS